MNADTLRPRSRKMSHTVETLRFEQGAGIPNHPTFPVLCYRQARPRSAIDLASWWTQSFSRNQWTGTWRWSVFDYHHFHPNVHEVLGVARGNAILLLGGPEGRTVEVEAGDVLLLPAGTGHKLEQASTGFQVIGAYPPASDPVQTNRQMSILSDSLKERIAAVPVPTTDPVYGEDGPLFEHWSSARP